MRRFILVTGASSGIGRNASLVLAQQGYEILAGVRTVPDGQKLVADGGANIHPLIMDVTDQSGMEKAREEAERIIGAASLVAVINNAGIVVNGAVLYIPLSEWQRQLDVNVMGVVRTTQLFFHLLARPKSAGDQHPRRIINMSSVSGLFASPFIGPYVASKHALEGLSDSLRREIYMYDIQVVILEPGNIETPIWEKAKQMPSYLGPEYDSIKAYKERVIEKQMAESISIQALDHVLIRVVTAKKVKDRYLVMARKWQFRLICSLPAKWVDRMIHKRLRNKSGLRPF